jgi:hypothetical protein
MSVRVNTVEPVVRKYLEAARDQVRLIAPSASASIATVPHRGGTQVSLTILAAPDANTLDLCVLIREQGAALSIEADLSEGGTGRILSEWPAREVGAGPETLNGLEQYVRSQVPAIASALT